MSVIQVWSFGAAAPPYSLRIMMFAHWHRTRKWPAGGSGVSVPIMHHWHQRDHRAVTRASCHSCVTV
eukprot:3711482-Rhodomonas_salina.2